MKLKASMTLTGLVFLYIIAELIGRGTGGGFNITTCSEPDLEEALIWMLFPKEALGPDKASVVL